MMEIVDCPAILPGARVRSLAEVIGEFSKYGGDMAVFISYRREDAAKASKKLANAFRDRLGYDLVFHDASSIDAGENWRRRIDKQLKSTRLFVCVIGPDWLSAFAERKPKDDVVLYEIVKALKARRRIKLMPILVGGAAFPDKSSLPRRLRKLADYQAFSFKSGDKSAGVDRLMSKAADYLPQLEEMAARAAIKQCLDNAITNLVGQVEGARQRVFSAIDDNFGSINESALMAELWDYGRAAGDQAVQNIGQLPFRIRALKPSETRRISEALHLPKQAFGSRDKLEDRVDGLAQKIIDEEKTLGRYLGGASFGGGTGAAAGTLFPVVGNVVGAVAGAVSGGFMANSEANADIRRRLKSEFGDLYTRVLEDAEELRSDAKWTALAEDLARGRIR